MTTLKAIDPPNCGCTECLIGEYVPLQLATADNIAMMLLGELRNHTSELFRVALTGELGEDLRGLDNVEVTVRAVYSSLSWTLPRFLGKQVLLHHAMGRRLADVELEY